MAANPTNKYIASHILVPTETHSPGELHSFFPGLLYPLHALLNCVPLVLESITQLIGTASRVLLRFSRLKVSQSTTSVPTSLAIKMSVLSLNASWEVPPQSWLNISDCDAISPWIAHVFVIASGAATSDTSGHDDIPTRIVVDFLRSLVPNNWTQPTDGDLLLWYLDFFDYIDEDKLQSIGMFSLQNCGPKVCPNLGFSGDSDLSGIGVSLLRMNCLKMCMRSIFKGWICRAGTAKAER